MTRYLVAALVALLCAAGNASADYLLIVVNLNAKPAESGSQGGAGMIGGAGMLGSPPAAGALGTPPPLGGTNQYGNQPGGMGGMGGLRGGMPAPGAGPSVPEDADESPDLIVALLEVRSVNREKAKLFNAGVEVPFEHYLLANGKGSKIEVSHKTASYEATLISKRTVKERFDERKSQVMKGNEKPPTAEAIQKVALYALELGLVPECAKVMDEIAESDKTHAAVKAYLQVKAELDRPLKSEKDEASRFKEKLLSGYKILQDDKHHFALVHNGQGADEGKAQLDQLEHAFRAYYYWWALRGVALPVPAERLVAVQTEKPDDFVRLRTTLTASPTLADSFFARRETVSIISNRRSDAPYDKLEKASKPWWDANFDRHLLLSHLPGKGIPKGKNALEKAAFEKVARQPRFLALLLKAMENEYEQTGISHEASRQMLFATKQLPRNVHAPEWIQFGMGSFFETALQSPWPSIGAANPYWLPRFKDFVTKKKYEASYAATLRKVVTDGYFREKPKADKGAEAVKEQEASLRKARAASWSLTYYLARAEGNLPKLQRYFKELSRQPRDVELDEKTLWGCFARAFELDTEEKVNALASNWMNYVRAERMDASTIHEKIRKFYADMAAAQEKQASGNTGGNTGPNPGQGNLGPQPGRGSLGPQPGKGRPGGR
jgi:hypothetical protein